MSNATDKSREQDSEPAALRAAERLVKDLRAIRQQVDSLASLVLHQTCNGQKTTTSTVEDKTPSKENGSLRTDSESASVLALLTLSRQGDS